ncbi:MAG: pyruvate, phosphate dikinase, partial [Candidatus Aerophobetes bacterium]|nr:pyruvate, phosphate dikinase [Candidatus Aerophobetes bacterium]
MGGYIYFFEEEKAEGSAKLRNLLGGKGANLAEMANLGIRVPPGFTISTEVCTHYTQKGSYPKGLSKKIEENLKRMEKVTGKKFGDVTNPLLVSVRSGARISMPGMMDTVLNLGLNDNTVEGLAKQTRNERFAYDAYRRLLQMFGNVVLGLEGEEFENILERKKKERSIQEDIDLTSEDFKEIVAEFKKLIKDKKKIPFPQDPFKQLEIAINAVFASWNNKRAVSYRKINKIPGHWGTAVNVQAMVFGNMGNNSGTGVGFTRDPATGERILYGEYLLNAQGEDVVAGIRTPKPLSKLKEDIARVYGELSEVTQKLERHYKDVQDFEFTIEEGKLYLLQTRTGKRTAQAAVKIACDMVKERLITKKEALMRIKPEQLEQLLHRRIDPRAKVEILARGLPASPGASTGKIVFTADRAVEMAEKGEKVILVRQETSPEDIHGMAAAQGILTARGGMTCVAGESLLLTTKGFFSAEEVYQMFERGENISILSYDSSLLRPKWKRIIACGRRKSKVIEIIVSQTGRSEHNSLRITSDHKMYTFHHRKLIKRPLANILKEAEYLCIIDRIPEIERVINDEKIAYLVGSILTDGYINLKRTKGNVTFTQKNTPEKSKFIERVSSYFFDVFDARFNIMRTKDSYGNIKGREIRGEAMDLICTQRKPALILEEISQNLVSWILNLDEVSILNFLAGAIDGDGVFYNNRIQIFASKERLCQAVIVACLKLGVLPQVTVNREIYDIQILERINDILNYTTRVNGLARERVYGTKFFSAKQLFSDIADKVNYKGRTKEYIKRNLLIDGGKIIRDILPICKDGVKGEIKKALNSNLRMYRVKKINEDERTYVYNFEVDSIDKLDKNYIVFTKMYTPLLISNSHAAVVA